MNDLSPAPGTARVWWLGQGGFVFEGPNSGPLVVDPYLSNACSKGPGSGSDRLFPVPVPPGDLRYAALFLTHDHKDHTDPETLPPLVAANPNAAIYAPPASVAHLERLGIAGDTVHPVGRNETIQGDGWHVHTVHAEHSEDSVGLVFVFDDGPVIYHTADTEYFPEIEAAGAWGVSLLSICINGRWGNMGIADAARVTVAIRPAEVLPMHWGLFAGNTADPDEFARVLAEVGATARPVILAAGHGEHLARRQGDAAAV